MQHQGMILGLHSILFLTKLKAATAIMLFNQPQDPLIKLRLTAHRSFHHGFLTHCGVKPP
jgi:hypothetical protein